MIISLVRAFALVLAGLGFLGAGGCDQAEAKAVREADVLVDKTLDAKDGEAYVKLVSKDSIALYDRLVKLAREADRVKVDSLPYSEKRAVLEMRHRASASEIKKFDGRGYLIHAVKNGWLNSTSSMGTKRGRIQVKRGSAKIALTL